MLVYWVQVLYKWLRIPQVSFCLPVTACPCATGGLPWQQHCVVLRQHSTTTAWHWWAAGIWTESPLHWGVPTRAVAMCQAVNTAQCHSDLGTLLMQLPPPHLISVHVQHRQWEDQALEASTQTDMKTAGRKLRNITKCEIWNSHNGNYWDYGLLCGYVVW